MKNQEVYKIHQNEIFLWLIAESDLMKDQKFLLQDSITYRDAYKFFLSANKIRLTEIVPLKYIKISTYFHSPIENLYDLSKDCGDKTKEELMQAKVAIVRITVVS